VFQAEKVILIPDKIGESLDRIAIVNHFAKPQKK